LRATSTCLHAPSRVPSLSSSTIAAAPTRLIVWHFTRLESCAGRQRSQMPPIDALLLFRGACGCPLSFQVRAPSSISAVLGTDETCTQENDRAWTELFQLLVHKSLLPLDCLVAASTSLEVTQYHDIPTIAPLHRAESHIKLLFKTWEPSWVRYSPETWHVNQILRNACILGLR
jgi:hypothetical protein